MNRIIRLKLRKDYQILKTCFIFLFLTLAMVVNINNNGKADFFLVFMICIIIILTPFLYVLSKFETRYKLDQNRVYKLNINSFN